MAFLLQTSVAGRDLFANQIMVGNWLFAHSLCRVIDYYIQVSQLFIQELAELLDCRRDFQIEADDMKAIFPLTVGGVLGEPIDSVLWESRRDVYSCTVLEKADDSLCTYLCSPTRDEGDLACEVSFVCSLFKVQFSTVWTHCVIEMV